MAEAYPLRIQMERHKDKLINIIDSEFGLLDILLKNRVLSDGDIGRIKDKSSRYEKNEMLLDYIARNERHEDFLAALKVSSQTHIANWIIADGKYWDEFALDWPLTDKENNILSDNQAELVEILDTDDLLDRLLCERIISNRHKASIEAKPTDYDRNDALLDIVRRLSRENYFKLIKCLRDSNQGHVADIFKKGGVIVPVHATLQGDNLDEAETQIVNEMTDYLCQRTTSMEQANRLIAGLQLNIIAVKRGESIVLFIGCSQEEDFSHLCKVVDNMKMKEAIEKLLILFLPSLKTKIVAVKIFDRDIAKAKESFAQSIKDNGISNSFAVVLRPSSSLPTFINAFKINLNRPEAVTVLQPLPDELERGGVVASAVYRNSVFACGLGRKSEEIWRLDATYYLCKWSKCASMSEGKRNQSIAFVDHVLYICGGLGYPGRRTLDDVEAYNTFGSKCSTVGKLAYAVHSSGNCVPYKASLYIFGGYNDKSEAVNNVQVYDTKSNTCTLLTKQIPIVCAWPHSVLFKESVILLDIVGCFIYHFGTQTWKSRDKFKLEIAFSRVIINDDKLFAIGCGPEKDEIKWIPVANILNDEPTEWRHHAKLPNNYFEDLMVLFALLVALAIGVIVTSLVH